MEQFGQSLRDLSPFFEKEAGDAYTVSCMLDSVIQGIERTADLQGSNDLPMSLLPMFEEVQKTINTENKKYYAAINKLYRAIERKFPMTPENLFDPSLFATDECLHAIDASIMDHLLRNGKYDLAEMFKSVCDLSISLTVRSLGLFYSNLEHSCFQRCNLYCRLSQKTISQSFHLGPRSTARVYFHGIVRWNSGFTVVNFSGYPWALSAHAAL